MKTEFKFNAIKLIEEVRKRPLLYSTAGPVDREQKLALWRQVGAALYPDWGDFNKAACYDRILTLQRKWRSLRDAYNREIRLRQQPGPRRSRRVYIYFKRLSFLGKFEGDVHSEDDPEGENETLDAEPLSEPEPKPKAKKTKKKKKRRRRSDSSETQQRDEEPSESPGGSSDSDRLFLLSFLPEMQRLPPHIKMWARTRIANVMQEAVSYHYDNQPLPDTDIKHANVNTE
ncbi:uncharacterized protein LOC121728346 isoform X2 [Aricia agestis]|uniref:uncharacterized protein LOC121728346 isoform X2 n=1 Tax=Aricia agestis TaxID=91739 RepID=UPI001C20671A|nr:uncharacterized protein LOC121728346 isoform X2 [Aricia agestis]